MYIESIFSEQSLQKLVDNNICKYTTLRSIILARHQRTQSIMNFKKWLNKWMT